MSEAIVTSHILMWSLFGMAASAVSFHLYRALVRKGLLTERHVKLIARACGIMLLSFGFVIGVYAFMSGPVVGDVSALLYMLVGVLLIFGKPQLKPAAVPIGKIDQTVARNNRDQV